VTNERNLPMKYAIAALLLLASPVCAAPAEEMPLYQLRTYQLLPQSKAIFHARFRDHAMRIMQRHGFHIQAIWEADHNGRPEFVYLLRWKNEAAMKAGWAGFMADEEWIRIKRDTVSPDAPIVGEIDSKTMALTDYSPTSPFNR
jgi:hypothetical protein